jgi:hypothetical protein
MQPFMKLLRAILLAHLVGDFSFRSSSMVRGECQGIRAYIEHGAVHLLVLVLFVAVFFSVHLLISLYRHRCC